MIVRMFLLWAQVASPGHRAEATAALAKAFLHADLSGDDRREAETALTAMLDDPSPGVRLALAESLASSPDAPRHIMVALAGDQNEIAAIVLRRSPVLVDADLVDCAALGDAPAQVAVASRAAVSPAVSAALAEIACPAALASLAANEGAAIGHSALIRMIERHGDAPEVRESLLARADLPADVAQAIAAALARQLAGFVVHCGWLSSERSNRVAREAREKTAVALSAASGRDDVRRLVDYLRRSDQLTPALILRAILSGQTTFVEAAFGELSGLASHRVASILRDPHGFGFRALFRRSGLAPVLQPAFESALSAFARTRHGGAGGAARLSRELVRRALAGCETLPSGEATRLLALLRRFEVEAARDDAREAAESLADEAALAMVLKHAPEALGEGELTRRRAA